MLNDKLLIQQVQEACEEISQPVVFNEETAKEISERRVRLNVLQVEIIRRIREMDETDPVRKELETAVSKVIRRRNDLITQLKGLMQSGGVNNTR